MLYRTDIVDYKSYSKAIFTYAITVTAAFVAKSSGFRLSTSSEEETQDPQRLLKRSVLQTNQTQILPLVEAVEVGRFNVSSDLQDIVVQNNTAYVVAGETGLQIIDVSNASQSILLSHYDTSGFAHQIKLVGNYLYVADDLIGLMIIDVSNVSMPQYAGSYCMGHNPLKLPVTAVVVANSKAFIMSSPTSALEVVDISVPSHVFRSYFDTPDFAQSVVILNSIAYVADSLSLQIIDVSTPFNPKYITSINIPVYAVAAAASTVYLPGTYYLTVVNVTNPTMPVYHVQVSSPISPLMAIENAALYSLLPTSLAIYNITNQYNPTLQTIFNTSTTWVTGISSVGNIVYITDDLVGLKVISTANLSKPNLIGSFGALGGCQGVSVTGSIAYIAGCSGFAVVNVTNVTNPVTMGIISQLAGNILSIIAQENIVYVTFPALVGGYLELINVTNPNNPRPIAITTTPDTPYDVCVSGTYAYVASSTAGLQIFDSSRISKTQVGLTFSENSILTDSTSFNSLFFYTSQASGLVQIDSTAFAVGWNIPAPSDVEAVAVAGSVLYHSSNAIQLFDVTNPNNPTLLSTVTIPTCSDLTVAGYILYAIGLTGMAVVNISNPHVPIILYYNYTFFVSDIYLIGDIAYVSDAEFVPASLYVINFSNPRIPNILGSIKTLYGGLAVSVNNGIAYVADGRAGLTMINVTNPNSMQLLGNFKTIGTSVQISIVGSIAFLAENDFGLQLIDISDQTNLQILSNFAIGHSTALSFSAVDLIVVENIAYVAAQSFGLYLIDVSDPTLPLFIRNYDAPGNAYSVDIAGDYAYVACGVAGVEIYNLAGEANKFKTVNVASQVAVINNIAYLADSNFNLYILNISASNPPTELARIILSYHPLDMFADKHYLYIAEGLEGVEILDISNVAQPIFAGRITAGLTNAKSVKVEGSRLYVIDNYQDVVIFDIVPLFYLSGQMIIKEGERHVVPPSEVTVTSFPSGIYLAVFNVTHAQFELSTQPGIPITSFTLAEVQASQIIFVHDGGKIAPSFNLLVSDGTTTQGPFTANILFQPINYPPVLGFHFIQINEGQSIILNVSNLNATDDLTPSLQLQFITTLQSNSQFEYTSQPGVIITRFSGQDLVNGYVLFRHLDQSSRSDLTPFCMVSVFDGQLYSSPIQIQFVFHVAPKFITNQLTIYRGQVLTISANELQAIDPQVVSSLIFIINNVTHGTFTKTIFTQGEVLQGVIQFQHDGSDQPPSYSVSIQDPFMITASQPALITFTDKNPNLALNTAAIAGTVAGGAVGLGLLIGGIFAYRNYARNEQSRRNNPFAASVYQALKPIDTANFSSIEGQQFVQAIQTLKQELSQQGIDVDHMGTWELNQLAVQITLAIHNEISSKTNWQGESDVRATDISQAASSLALAVQKIRAGLYEGNIRSSI